MRRRWLVVVAVLAAVACRRGPTSTRDAEIAPDPLPPGRVIEVAASGALILDGAAVSADDLRHAKGDVVAIRGADDVPWAAVMRAIDLTKSAGLLSPEFVLATSTKRTRSMSLPKVASTPRGPAVLVDGGVVLMGAIHRVVIDRDGRIRNVDFAAPDDATARDRLSALLTKEPGAIVTVYADRAAPFGAVLDLTAFAQRAGGVIVYGLAPQ